MLPSAQNTGMCIRGSPFPPEEKPPKAPAAPRGKGGGGRKSASPCVGVGACAAAPGRPPLLPLLHVTRFAFKLRARRKGDITLIWPKMCGGLAFQNISGGGWGEELHFTGFSAISFRGRGCD